MEVQILRVIKKGNKFQVFTNVDEFAVQFTEDGLVKNRVYKDKTFTINKWEEIKKQNESSTIYDKVLHYIDYKPRTIKEVKLFLSKKGISEELIEVIIQELIDSKYLDDDLYIKMFIDNEIANLKGPLLIIHKLNALGIDKNNVLDKLNIYTKELQYSNAYTLAVKCLKQHQLHPIIKQKEFIFNKLMRSGYYSEIVYEVLSNLTFTNEKDNLN